MLDNNKIRGTSTLNKNKLHKVPIKGAKELEKKSRGYFEHITTDDNSITLVHWNDNSSVYLASSTYSSMPRKTVRRWDKEEKVLISLSQPNSIDAYNKGMGGVDRCDQNISAYRVSISGKMWWWALFAWFPDMVLQNAW